MNTDSAIAHTANAVWLHSLNEGRQERRSYLSKRLADNPVTGVPEVELRAHFDGMPRRYWDRVSENELVWGLRTIHRFIEEVASGESPGWTPIVDWRHVPERGFTKVMVCTWDRRGLLAKIAASFSAVRINVMQADVFTRTDNIVLDVFRVRDASGSATPDSARMQQMTFLLEGALAEPPRFASTWAGLYHKFIPYQNSIRPLIVLDNETSPEFTIVNIEASDRLGLLCDVLHALDDMRLNIAQAEIDTFEDVACDVLFVTDLHGRKILDRGQLRLIGDTLRQALSVRSES